MSVIENAYALVVGIANYSQLKPLPATVLKDARDIQSLLFNPQRCSYPPGNVTLLLDGEATQTALRQALATLAARADSRSTVFFYISSHGGRITIGPDAGEYLLPVDTKFDHSVDPLQILASSALFGAELTAALHAIRAQKMVVLFDCCHSSGIAAIKADVAADFKEGLPEHYYDQLAQGRGRVILASSRETEYAYVLPSAANSLFTEHLFAALGGAVPSRDGFIRIFDLFEYVHPKVTAVRSDQHPVLQVKLEENFPIVLYLGGQKSAEPTSDDAAGYRYDAYLSWVRVPADTAWVRDKLLPLLKGAGLRLVMTVRVEEPGVPAVVGVQRAVELAKRTVVILSHAYLKSDWAELENVAAQHLSVEQRRARLLPVVIDESLLNSERRLNQDVPLGLRQLSVLDVVDDLFGAENLARLLELIKRPVPNTR